MAAGEAGAKRREPVRSATDKLRAGRAGDMAPDEDRYLRLPAVDRAMSLFELLASSETGMTLSELSLKLNMPKSSTHYLINTLESRGYLQRTSNGRHSLGLRFA